MTSDPIRVGIVGANPERGWAVRAHVPALRALPEFAITAVSTTREESAREAAARFGAAHAFTDARRLAAHPDVDLVVVSVKVPYHAELIEAALDAGTPVLCEWPLARTTEEAQGLLDRAETAGVRHFMGLQGRFAPAVAYARDLIADGRVGRVTSAAVYSALGKGAGGTLPAWSAYTADRANGAGLLEVVGGHTLDVVEHLLGDIGALSAMLSTRLPQYTVEETGEKIEADTPDHVLVSAALDGGAVASAHLQLVKVTDARTRIEIAGTEGDLALVSTGPGGPYGVQIGELRLLGTAPGSGSWEELPIPDRYLWVPGQARAMEAVNVAQLYARLADDLRTDARTVPGFDEGVRLHRLLDAVRRSDATGTRRAAA
ncbi:Gfo/Idh/MocA family protein [Microbispora sp. ATCC PTA-5024]|uniref:Gfo/Idh/MocA family protein n=1 Tax=Microbispora sp. ATCC PTA-5024 TaxID=316330 RepID=UPI0003DBC0FD|nr:Gfo/Idh/MocA family oxidoreductase [Microbispora sp. ATCC PTA-5024]ETK32158.1 oxidoreductase [Microbispora sp. ATCC PTA-5024]